MLSRLPAVTRYLSVAALCVAGPAVALEFPLPPPGEDVVGEVQVIKGKYEDSFADLGNKYELGYSEMIAANPGVDAWLPVKKNPDGTIVDTDIVLPTQFILPPGKREGIVINLAEYRLYYFPKDQNKVYTFPLGIGREGWGSPLGQTKITAKTPNPTWTPPASKRSGCCHCPARTTPRSARSPSSSRTATRAPRPGCRCRAPASTRSTSIWPTS